MLADFDDIEYDLGCLMWYPNERILLPVTKFNLLQRKSNSISVEYVKLVQDPNSHYSDDPGIQAQFENKNISESQIIMKIKESFAYNFWMLYEDKQEEKIQDGEKYKSIQQQYPGFKIKQKKETYNHFDLFMLQLAGSDSKSKSKSNQEGIKNDLAASDYLKDKLGCKDPRVGKYNVLKLSHPGWDFERIFVFYDTKNFPFIERLNAHDLDQDEPQPDKQLNNQFEDDLDFSFNFSKKILREGI